MYLANLPAHITEQDLHDMLYKYGTVISTRVLRDGGSQSRGVGFARYSFRATPDTSKLLDWTLLGFYCGGVLLWWCKPKVPIRLELGSTLDLSAERKTRLNPAGLGKNPTTLGKKPD